MGKYEGETEEVSTTEERSERKHKHHHHKHEKGFKKEDSMKMESDNSPPRKHHHHKSTEERGERKHKHHHRHHSSRDDKDEERSKRHERKHSSKHHKKGESDNNDNDSEMSSTKVREHHSHSARSSLRESMDKSERSERSEKSGSPVVGSRLTPFNSDSIRSSRRNSRIISEEKEKSNIHLDANGSMEGPQDREERSGINHTDNMKPDKVDNIKPDTMKADIKSDTIKAEAVKAELTVIEEEQVVLVVDSAPVPTVIEEVRHTVVVSEEPRVVTTPIAPTVTVVSTTTIPTTATGPAPTVLAATSSSSASRPATPIITVTPGRGEHTQDAGNPGKIPSPLPDSLREAKRYSSIIEPPMPWESKKDKRKSRRKYIEHKKNVLGETIYKGHPSWLLMRDIQTGLFQSIKSVFTNAGSNAINLFYTPPVQVFPIAPGSTSTFKFKDYCPGAFFKLREHFGINHQDYVASICHNWNEVGTPGKSGSLFFFSQDNQYVLKTIPKREAKLLRSLLPSYYHHMVNNDNSLLTRFMGLHRVKPHKGRQVRFLVMGNLFRGPLAIHQRFDLKGSTVGRELSAEARKKKSPTFKDMDFRRLNKKIPLGPKMREAFLEQLAEDCKFLVKQNIMDYSLLIGIHFKTPGGDQDSDADSSGDEADSPMTKSAITLPQFVPEEYPPASQQVETIFEKEEGGLRGRAEDGSLLDEYYYIGIIDILMLYTMRKQVEHAYKSVMSRGGEISSVKPEEYAERFVKFMTDITG